MQTITLIAALVLCPAAYLATLWRMHARGVTKAPVLPMFFLFGTAGGWLLALALSPSGLAAVFMAFLLTAAPLALLVSAIQLARRPERSGFHRAAMGGGFAYPAILLALVAAGAVTG